MFTKIILLLNRISFYKRDFREICMGSLFLAAKVEETHRKIVYVALVFDQVFKVKFLIFILKIFINK